MEILQFLLKFLLSSPNGKDFAPILNLLKDNSFNIANVLKNIKPEMIMPLIAKFLSAQNKSPNVPFGQGEHLTPIASIADKDIVYALNKYLSAPCS